MATFAVTNSNDIIGALNYALSNLGQGNVSGNITIPGNVLVANTSTGVVTQAGNSSNPYSYLYEFVNIRYANAADGSSGFSVNPGNANYFGVYNSTSSTPSSNPSDYQWFGVSGGFGTANHLYYQTNGGRQITFQVANSSPSPLYAESTANVAIDLNIVSSANGAPGPRGPLAMAYIVTPSDPNLATSATLTLWFQSPRNSPTAPIGTGLYPVTGDTANFIYAAGATQPSATYTYNGSTWVAVIGQVIAGNLLVNGTISGNAIAANTIAAYNILSGTLTTNLFTANTISGNIISSNSITADKLVANGIVANTVVSTGAVLDDFNSAGFWLDGTTGNARFGNAVSIGNSLTIGSGSNIGSSAAIGTNLTVGSNATIGGNLVVGNNATIGANATIGTNLTVGNLITLGTLNSNTVNTTQIVPGSITTDKFVANTINGNIILGNSITADKLVANGIVANTVVSTGAVLGNLSSPGFWLDGTSGVARFGNIVSIGNNLSVGNNVTIGNNVKIGNTVTVGDTVTIGNNTHIGNSLTIGNNASIANSLNIGSFATIGGNLTVGSYANIGSNLAVGNNATIGGNLTVSGLVTAGNLLANTVFTSTMAYNSVSQAQGATNTGATFTNVNPYFYYTLVNGVVIPFSDPNEIVYLNGTIYSGSLVPVQAGSGYSPPTSITVRVRAVDQTTGGNTIIQTQTTSVNPYTTSWNPGQFNLTIAGLNYGSPVLTTGHIYQWYVEIGVFPTTNPPTSLFNSLTCNYYFVFQTLKR